MYILCESYIHTHICTNAIVIQGEHVGGRGTTDWVSNFVYSTQKLKFGNFFNYTPVRQPAVSAAYSSTVAVTVTNSTAKYFCRLVFAVAIAQYVQLPLLLQFIVVAAVTVAVVVAQ